MKNIITILFILLLAGKGIAQDFNKNLTAARTAYASGNLSSSRFAMSQMLHELDAAIGKEILKLLPAKMDALPANLKDDNTTGSSGVMGLFVQRTYGSNAKTASIDIINNSPMITSLNALLALPLLGSMGDANQKTVKVHGYKGILHKNQDSDTGKTSYDLQIPLQNTLLTIKADDTKEADILRFADTIPLDKIAQMAK